MSTMDSVLSSVESFSRPQLLETVRRIQRRLATSSSGADAVTLGDCHEIVWETQAVDSYLQGCSVPRNGALLCWSTWAEFSSALAVDAQPTYQVSSVDEALALLEEGQAPAFTALVVDLFSLVHSKVDPGAVLMDRLKAVVAILAELKHVLSAADRNGVDIVLRTADALGPVSLSDPRPPLAAVFHGWVLGAAIECPRLRITTVDMDVSDLHVLLALSGGAERQLVYRNGAVHFRMLRPVAEQFLDSGHGQSWGNCLIVGGAGEVGKHLSAELTRQGATRIWHVGRRPSAQVEEGITYLSVDVREPEQVLSLKLHLEQQGARIESVFHLAGTVKQSSIFDASEEDDWLVLAPKVLGGATLLEIFDDVATNHYALSSITSLVGTHGAASYCAANAFLDHLADRCNGRMHTINSGPLLGVGMASMSGFSASSGWEGLGVHPLEVEALADCLGALASRSIRHWLHARVDWAQLQARLDGKLSQALVGQLLKAPMQRPEVRGLAVSERLLALESDEAREHALQDYLLGLFRAAATVATESLDVSASIEAWGLDSLVLMEILKTVRMDLGLIIYPREMYTHSTLSQFAHYLAGQLRAGNDEPLAGGDSRQRHEDYLSPLADLAGVVQDVADRVPGVAFILSSPRSGSTLLRAMLQGHDQVFAPPELHLLGYTSLAQWHEATKENYFDQGLQRALMELHEGSLDEAVSLLGQWVDQDIAVAEVYRFMRERSGCGLLVDKSPSYASNPKALLQAELAFDKPRYIHLVRNPLAMIESFSRMRMHKLLGQQDNDGISTAERIWLEGNLNLEAFFARHVEAERVLRVDYETLVRDPETTLRGICAFLDIEFQPSMTMPYGVGRMNDGVREGSLAIEDPNFLKRDRVDASLADAWRHRSLDRPLWPQTVALAGRLGYDEALPASAKRDEAARQTLNVQAGEVSLSVSAWGRYEHPDYLCLHGLLDQATVWDDIAQNLYASGRSCIAPDIRGHGLSGHGSPQRLPALLDYVMDTDAVHRASGTQPLELVAHSFGAVIAVAYAAAFPERVKKLWLIEPVLLAEKRHDPRLFYREMVQFLAAPHEHLPLGSLQQAAERIRAVSSFLTQDRACELAERMTTVGDDGERRWTWDPRLRFRAGLGLGLDRDTYLQILHALEVDVHIVFGRDSRSNRRKDIELQAQGLDDDCVTFIDGGHNLHLQHPDEVTRIITRNPGISPIQEVRDDEHSETTA
ncbi:alpha/beta fold hydrolase [Pseudomonas entomophila]|uniref:Alpha/beta fold hydrolase n=2 Tax=Pseudomonas entomophila TaxID=312306 RepID=A0ABY9QSW1_9PSED|nr:alpha/beta fold hydrolase [Pseudomonas entomophila]WMW06180.1 alpha/beta fold hydrolase [Pseudomonas entomophila]CAK18136.1 putative polyketide synthase [Pseudomonas entomophila L48]